MAVVNGPQFPKVAVGKRTLLGVIKTATDILQFSLSQESYYHSGSIVIQSVPVGGTITTFTANLLISLDGGVTFAVQTGGVGTATVASTTSGLNFQTATLQNISIPGVGGECSLQFAAATFVLGTGTGASIWALVA